MREIKFRAFDKYMKCMCAVVKINFRCQHLMLRTKQKEQYETSFEEVELLQCTGLKDKNGVEIYEGDILSNSFMDSFQNEKSYVIWRDGTWRLVVRGAGTDRPLYDNLGWDTIWNPYYGGVEVIGNIYENPELIGKNHG